MDEKDIDDLVGGIFVVIIVILIAIVLPQYANNIPDKAVYTIRGISGVKGDIAGRFFLGVGTIKTERRYYFYIESNDTPGVYSLTSVSTERVVIKEYNGPPLWIHLVENTDTLKVPVGTVTTKFNLQ